MAVSDTSCLLSELFLLRLTTADKAILRIIVIRKYRDIHNLIEVFLFKFKPLYSNEQKLPVYRTIKFTFILRLELVTHTPDSLDHIAFVPELATELLDVSVYCSGISKIVIVPDIIENLLS